jgi:ribose/xylose/arabinose/galactoside ABC-type transport system permease subunit
LAQKVNSSTVTGVPEGYAWLGQHKIGTVPVSALFMLVLAAVLWVMVTQTPLGRSMCAIGGSREASHLAGLRIGVITIVALAISGVMAALGGLMLSSTVGSGQPGAGDGLLLDAFTAAAIGTVTFRRGEYNIAGTVLAVVLLTTLFNGMTMIGWAPYWQYIVKGVVLVAAVGASMGTSQDR